VDVGFNVNYLIDAISVLGKESFMFEVGSGIKASVIKQIESDDYLCIVMPLKI
jgi:DNA polymerase-3 subunit beta